METYEYAGFTFEVHAENEDVRLVAAPGQHPAAYKDKHARNARDQYLSDRRRAR